MNEWTPTEDEQWFMENLDRLSPLLTIEMMRLLKISYLRGQLSGLQVGKSVLNDTRTMINDIVKREVFGT